MLKTSKYIFYLIQSSKSNWTYKHFFEEKQENCVILKTTYKDNKFLPKEYIDSLLGYKETNPLFFKIYAEGEFATLDKTVFNNWKIQNVENKGDLLVGIDFGFSNDPTSIIGCYLDGSNLYVVDEIYRKGLFVEDIARELKKRKWDRYDVACDSAEPRTIADLKRQGIKAYPVKKGKDSISHGISWLHNLHIFVDPKCENLD